MSLEDALIGLRNAMGDLTSLEVRTYVGEIDVVMDGVTDSTDFEAALKNAAASGKIALKLVTQLSFDGDGVVLVPTSAPANYVQEAHDAALEAGNRVREGLISLFADVIGLKASR